MSKETIIASTKKALISALEEHGADNSFSPTELHTYHAGPVPLLQGRYTKEITSVVVEGKRVAVAYQDRRWHTSYFSIEKGQKDQEELSLVCSNLTRTVRHRATEHLEEGLLTQVNDQLLLLEKMRDTPAKVDSLYLLRNLIDRISHHKSSAEYSRKGKEIAEARVQGMMDLASALRGS